jgi:hypothetical protein
VPSHAVARGVLIALVAGTAALAVGASLKSKQVEDDLTSDLQKGGVTGRSFVDSDDTGKRWNRIARGSAFASGVFLLGLGTVWLTGYGDEIQSGPLEHTPADDRNPIFPVTSFAPAPAGFPLPARAPAR